MKIKVAPTVAGMVETLERWGREERGKGGKGGGGREKCLDMWKILCFLVEDGGFSSFSSFSSSLSPKMKEIKQCFEKTGIWFPTSNAKEVCYL